MKKTLLFAAALTMLLASCDKNNDGKKELDAEFALETVEALTYGEPVALTGTITSNTAIDKVVFTGALNVLENTAKNITLGSQRGYMYSGMKRTSLGGGTTGRQCDVYKYGDHQIMDENVDINFTMKYVRGSWAGKSYHPELFTAVDNIFVNLKKAETNLEKIKAFYALGEIQRKLDNSTLGVTEEPTSLGGKTYLRKWVGAGNGKSLEEVQRAGDYIIIRSVRQAKGEETPRYYYGLIQVMMFEYDDAQTFVEKDGLRFIDPEKAKDLFMKPVYLDIKTQCEIAE